MSQTVIKLGFVPKNRGEYDSNAKYYKDNIVQYNGSSYIADPVGYNPAHPEAAYNEGVAPYSSDPATPNAGWAVFSNDSSGVGEGVYNVSVDHTTDSNPKKYATLSAALADVPQAKQKGGMTIRYIQSDNKYVQYRLTVDEWSINTEDWAITEEGVYIESPEFFYVKTDNEGKVLWAIKTDGSIYYGAGVPKQVIDYVTKKIAEVTVGITDLQERVSAIETFLNGFDVQTLIQYLNDTYGEYVESPEYLQAFTDIEYKVLGGREKDGTLFENVGIKTKNISIGGFKTENIEDLEDRMEISVDADNRIVSYRDKQGVLHEEGGIVTNKIELSKSGISKLKADLHMLGEIWYNEYPNIFDGMAIREKLLERNDDITILVIGDSLSAFCNQASYQDQSVRPCQMICHNWIGNMWNYVNDVEIDADRFDSQKNPFEETGTFSDDPAPFYDDLPYWTQDAQKNSGNTQNGTITRYSTDANASLSFNWDLDSYEKLHFIHRLDYRGTEEVTISLQEGNGYIEVYDESNDSWVEANGYVFSQKIAQLAEGNGYAWTLANWRLKFRKASGASGTVHISMAKGSDEGYFMYWGVEKWNGNRIILVNSARGGREVEYLQDVVKNDIIGRKPDLLIFQLVLINEYDHECISSHNANTIVNHFQDFILGNRSGHENQDSLKSLSGDFGDFQIVTIVPNVRYEFFADNSESAFKTDNLFGDPSKYMDKNAATTWNMVKKMLSDNGVRFVDINAAQKREAFSRGWGFKQAYNSSGMLSPDGFTIDTVHPNVLGSLVWAKHIAPIFDISE